MRNFNFREKYSSLLTPEIVTLLASLHEFKGRQEYYNGAKQDVLTRLLESAKIQSTDASNRIEGIITTAERLRQIVKDKTLPGTRSEKEIAGYRDVLGIIHESYEYIPPKPNMILQMHRDLYKFSGKSIGGSYKSSDNVIAEEHEDGTRTVRFTPVPAWETPDAVSLLCDEYEKALADSEMDPLILIPVFVLDFLCIHPFNDGNGRMSRLLTLLLLYRSGYTVGKYISIEKIISDSKETYYETLQESSFGWHENKNDYVPFVRYMLGVLSFAYTQFSEKVGTPDEEKLSKPGKIREVIRNNLGNITKTQIMEKCPGISQVTVQRTLSDLLKSGEILKIGGGRYTSYVWNGDNK